ncbi:MAG: alpha/beta hydrolase [Myxococcales bacterium]|nr:alpha/beta hydrolase [Myxococcales bacterium]
MTEPYDHPLISQRYFFPVGGEALPRALHAAPVSLGDGIGAYWSRPLGGDAPTLLYLHGNGECIAHQLGHWPAWAREAGLDVMFVDYPGYGASAAAGPPTFSGCRAAARAAADHLLRESSAPILPMGRSAGSLFATDVGALLAERAPRRLFGLVIESGISDTLARLRLRITPADGIDDEALAAAVARDFDQRAKVEAVTAAGARVLVLHTRHDGIVEVEQGEQLARWAGEHGELVIFDRGDHNSIQLVNEAAYGAALRRFVAERASARRENT